MMAMHSKNRTYDKKMTISPYKYRESHFASGKKSAFNSANKQLEISEKENASPNKDGVMPLPQS